MSNVRSYTLKELPKPHWIHSLEFDDEFVFIVGKRPENVSILRRATGQLIWTLSEHIRRYGPPTCFRSASWHTDDRHSFLLREQIQVPVPEWVQALSLGPTSTASRKRYEWKRIAIDQATKTLLILGGSVLLIVPNYRAMLCDEAIPSMYMYLSWPENESCVCDAEGPEDISQTSNGTGLRRQKTASLAACDGRTAVILDTLTLFDLQTHSKGRTWNGDAVQVPFSVYEWTDGPLHHSINHETVDLFRDCESVVMDTTSIFCVTNQTIEREAVNVGDFPDDYHALAVGSGSKHVTGFHFDKGALPCTIARHTIERSMHLPTAEGVN